MNNSRNSDHILKYGKSILISAENPIPTSLASVLSLMDIDKLDDSLSLPKIGITAANVSNDNYRNDLINLLHAQCKIILVVWFGSDIEWNKADWNSLAGDVVKKVASVAELISVLTSPLESTEWRRERLFQRLQAKALYSLLRDFGHNSKSDITNHFLAPARMLLSSGALEQANELWNSDSTKRIFSLFDKSVCEQIYYIHGHLGAMICDHMKSICNCFDNLNTDNQNDTIKLLEQLMVLLTECRTQAGEEVMRNRPVMPELAYCNDKSVRRILVIDDDIDTWKPAIEILEKKLDEVEIYVSRDASNYFHLKDLVSEAVTGFDVISNLPDFDLILLDIYLKDKNGNDLNGLEFLGKIRARIMHLPVILWTTSTDKELPSQAALANGFIFKKTATIETLASIIKNWLSVGKSQRLWSLPNPFYDYALRDPVLREVALAFTKWTLRYMDCFHAIDHFYFKYFNDHGGRHILGVLDAVSKLLRPFLFGNSLLSEKTGVRNKQLFCLYIAILCHEFGMFPIYKDEVPPVLATDEYWKQMEDMRKLHAIRGMLMLRSLDDGYLNQFNVDGLRDYLSYLKIIHHMNVIEDDSCAVIALLVGYHQRCLDLSSSLPIDYTEEDGFSKRNGIDDNKSPKVKIDLAAKNASIKSKNWTKWKDVKDITTRTWQQALGSKSIWDINSIRKLCAILRFADALDVDHTRVPADFLLNDEKRRALQDIEDCKRQVVSSVQIDQGVVSLEFYASKLTDEWFNTCFDFAKKGFESIKKKISILDDDEKEKKDFNALFNISTIKPEQRPVFEELLTEPEQTKLRSKINTLMIDPWAQKGDLDCIEKYIKGTLQVYFTCLKYDELCTDNKDIQSSMATAAAMLVILEIKDEYKAIMEVGLQDVIKLNKNIVWLGEQLPSILKTKNNK